MDNLTDSDEVEETALVLLTQLAIQRRLAMQHNRWWLKQPGSHSAWNQLGRWTRRSFRKCQIFVRKRIGPFYQRHEMTLLTLWLVACLGGLAYGAWWMVSQAEGPARLPTANETVTAGAWYPAILTAVMLYWWVRCRRFVSLPFRLKTEGVGGRPVELTDFPLPVALFVIMLFNACYVGLICAGVTHFAIALVASFLATWITLQFIKATTIWFVQNAPERRFFVGQPFFDRPSLVRLALVAVVLAATLVLCSPPFTQWSDIAFSPLTWIWTTITRLAQNQITTWESILFLMLLGSLEFVRWSISATLTWQARRQILSRYRGAEISPRSSLTREGSSRSSESAPQAALETFFRQKMNETTLPSWRRGVVDTILPRELRQDLTVWITVVTIGLLYGVMIFNCWSLVNQSNTESSIRVLKMVSFTFGSTMVTAIEMLALYRWLCTYSFTIYQQPLSTFGIWKQVQQKGSERLLPQFLACLPMLAVLVLATKDFTVVTQWLLAVTVVLVAMRTMLVGLLFLFQYEKLIGWVTPLLVFLALFACLMLTLVPAIFVVSNGSSTFWLLVGAATSCFCLLTVELLRRNTE